jgi:hypothetical protein
MWVPVTDRPMRLQPAGWVTESLGPLALHTPPPTSLLGLRSSDKGSAADDDDGGGGRLFTELVWCRGPWQCWFWTDVLDAPFRIEFAGYDRGIAASTSRWYNTGAWGRETASPWEGLRPPTGTGTGAGEAKGWDPDRAGALRAIDWSPYSDRYEDRATYGPERRVVPSAWKRSDLERLPPPSAEEGFAVQFIRELPTVVEID